MTKHDQDGRILVRIGGACSDDTALLVEDGAAVRCGPGRAEARFAIPGTAHALGCACCLPRAPVALALGRLFLARARGEVALFHTVVAVTRTQAGAAAVLAALDDDAVTRARFRLAPDQTPGLIT